MKHFTKTEYAQLVENGKIENRFNDHVPTARFFVNGTGGTLLVTAITYEKPLIVYGLFDLASDFSKMTYVDLERIATVAKENGFEMKRDDKFNPKYPISAYAKFARRRHAVSDIKQVLNSLEENKS